MSNVLELKQNIRCRDGLCCRICGITAEQYEAKYGCALEVHRVVPGIHYNDKWCVTLCIKCHRSMPDKRDNLISWGADYESGVRGIVINNFSKGSKQAFEKLFCYAKQLAKEYPELAIEPFGMANTEKNNKRYAID